MREGGDHPADQHDGEDRGEGGEQIADDEQPHQQHQHPLAGDLGAEGGHQRGAEHDAERVAGDQEAGGGDGDPEVVRDLGQKPHDHELGRSDSEGPDRESQKR